MIEAKHKCPWPGCTRGVGDRFWGCIEHWTLIPVYLKNGLRLAENSGLESELIHAKASIQRWIVEDYKPDERGAQQMMINADPGTSFASGVTIDGRVFLLWPERGEYITLSKEESAVAVRAIRAMLAVTA